MHAIKQMAWTGETPWHGLGEDMQQNQSLADWAEKSGLAVGVKTTPVEFAGRQYEGKLVIHSDDNDKTPFGIVTPQFKIFQPIEVIEFFRDLVEDVGFTLETAGRLWDGERVWALAKVDQGFTLGGDDKVIPYLLLTTGYDGKTSTTAKFTSTRVVCNNTLSMSLNNKSEASVKVGHRSMFDASGVKAQLGMTEEVLGSFRSATEALTRIRLDSKKANEMVNKILNITEESRDIDQATAVVLSQMYNSGNYIGSNMASANGTAWGLLNVFTQFLDHNKSYRSADAKLDNVWFGAGDKMKSKAFSELLELA